MCIVKLEKEFEESAAAEVGEAPSVESSTLLHDLVMLRLYEASPSRSKEVRLLEWIEWQDLNGMRGKLSVGQYAEKTRRNILTQRPLGNLFSFHGNYKTFRSKGVDETEYQQDRFPEFCDSLRRYIDDGYRKTLVSSHKHHFVFVDAGGDGFDDRSFSRYLGTLLQRLSGQRMTSNLLRSSFISDLYSSTSNPDVRESAAILMRHSVNEAMRTYDRRDPASRKEAAQAILSTKKRELDREDSDRPVKIVDSLFSRGDVVAVPYRDDDSGDANFWLAYVIKSSACRSGADGTGVH
jgi:hypothetical protein